MKLGQGGGRKKRVCCRTSYEVRIAEAARRMRRREKYLAGTSAQYIWWSSRKSGPAAHQRGARREGRIRNRGKARVNKRE